MEELAEKESENESMKIESETHSQATLCEHIMGCLCDVGCMHQIVVGIGVLGVALFQLNQESVQGLCVNLQEAAKRHDSEGASKMWQR